jgi:hypothetical protein
MPVPVTSRPEWATISRSPGGEFTLGTASGVASVAAIGGLLVLAPVSTYGGAARRRFRAMRRAARSGNQGGEGVRLSECNAKFAGRRARRRLHLFRFHAEPQFRHCGPNPTPEEQKKIDEEYIGYLERERRDSAAAALAVTTGAAAVAAGLMKSDRCRCRWRARQQPARVATDPPRTRSLSGCPKGTFSCDWPRLSGGINDIMKMFGPTPTPTSTPTPGKGKKS